jgi:hypothetical protein
VRQLQRQYVELWVEVVREVYPELAEPSARSAVHSVFGLLNSTPHLGRPGVVARAGGYGGVAAPDGEGGVGGGGFMMGLLMIDRW